MVQTICIMLEVDEVGGERENREREMTKEKRGSWVSKVIPRTDARNRRQSKESARVPLYSFTSVPRKKQQK